MSRALLNKITLALTAVGCIIALVLTYEHFFPAAGIGCTAVGGDCHSTIESAYGKLGPIPTSIVGLGMYLTLAGICVLRTRALAGRNSPGPGEKQLGASLFAISALAFCISWWLQYTALFVLDAFCPWCLASALTVTAIFAVNAYDLLILGRALTGEQKMLSGVVAFIGVMLLYLYGPQILYHIDRVRNPGEYANLKPPTPPETLNAPGVHPREEIMAKWLHVKGKPTATYTIIEFGDYACSHCAAASEVIDAAMKSQPDRYRVAFRNFPLGKWPYSAAEATAAEAADLQGKFWEMHDILYKHQSDAENPTFTPEIITTWARSIGLNVNKLQKDMESEALVTQVQTDHTIGQKNRISSTPTFYVVPSDPQGKIMMVIGEADLKTVLDDPKDPFWSGNPSSLKNSETSGTP